MTRVTLACCVLLLVTACSWTNQVRKRAAFDLACPEEKVDVQTISSVGAQYGARGCGKQAAYVVRDGQVLLNSPIQSNDPAPAPQPEGAGP